MHLPPPQWLGPIYGLSEFFIALGRRAKNSTATPNDQGSLKLIWSVVAASVILAIVAAYRLPGAAFARSSSLYTVGFGLFVLGLLLRWWSVIHLGKFFTIDVAIATDHRLVDTGPFRWVRHPSYLGALLAFLGLGVCMGNYVSLLLLVVPCSAVMLKRISVEEAALNQGLGSAYAEYSRKVKRLLPFVY